MAFVLSPDDPLRVHDFEYDGDHVLICRVGVDPDTHKTYFAAVGLDPLPENRPEYWFAIIEKDAYSEVEKMHLGGQKLAKVFSLKDRSAILDIVCRLTASLLDWTKPKMVSRITNDAYQGAKGIEKHNIISAVFVACGYRVTKCDSWHGKRVWLCERLNEIPIAPAGGHE
ncbi:MAG: hypothetical protein HYU59_07250 [Magnetospirillum gryphiswaldense]|nr:hypothetical protein [Magnetospirillum gryphiswaldense]